MDGAGPRRSDCDAGLRTDCGARRQDAPGCLYRRRHGPAYYHRLLRPHAPQRSTRRAIMKVRFDQEADALYIRLDEAKVVESEEVKPGLVLDFDADGRVVGFELLNAGRQLPAAQLRQIQFEVA